MVTYQEATLEELFHNTPPLLYKYRSWENPKHKRILSESELFFPSPQRFNDPYDCGLPYRPDPEDKDIIKIKNKLEELAPRQFPRIANDPKAMEEEVARQLFYIQQDPETYFRDNYGFKKEDLSAIYGVLSLTPHPGNFLMWSHYADSHRGFAVGFDSQKLITQNFGTFKKVDYENEIPIVSALDMQMPLMYKLIYTKAKVWQYEDEYRITRISRPNSTATFSPASLRTVHLGVNMPFQSRMEIIDIVKRQYPGVRVFDMNIGKIKFELVESQVFG
jgi:hypothetical protein